MPNCFRLLSLLPLIFLLACSGPLSRRPGSEIVRPTPLILVSIDGFRADYLDRGITPTLNALAKSGVHAEYMRPSFPTQTFPNHYALITGLRPDRNGIVANTMEDDRIPQQKFAASNRKAVEDARWWNDGTPLWITAKRSGLHSGIMFWPGSEAPVHGSHPDFWAIYDQKLQAVTRVDSVLDWLALPADQSPSLMTLYLDTIDDIGHHFGPDSAELDAELRIVDATVRRLVDGLIERGLEHSVNLIIVSDHGMVATSPDRVINLDEILPGESARVVSYGVVTGIVPRPGHEREAESILLGEHENMQCWRKTELPARFHYGTHRRVPAIVCLANHGWTIASQEYLARKKHFSLGEHGYDNEDPDMRAIFIAHGPAFRSGVVLPPFDNVDVYPLLAWLLGLEPEPHDGNFDMLAGALKMSRPTETNEVGTTPP
ncbi:ectonucleotide pyrophosphatase/phosphodiesterase [Dokdonella sp.]|uniref:alkaline phosphatase family protein n=1 Tax=Dokdonella sp. TaxID=2291710 RepID=UPI003C6A6C31